MKPAPPHITDAVIELLRDATCKSSAAPNLSPKQARDLVASASAHFVLQALAPSLTAHFGKDPAFAELIEFAAAIRDANKMRNDMLTKALIRTAAVLNTLDITPVALKGAAFLLQDTEDHAPWRFMSDIDLLVPAARLADCVGALENEGFHPQNRAYDPQWEAHYPPLISPCATFSIELHTRLFATSDHGVCAENLIAGTTNQNINGAQIKVPGTEHRIAYVLLHAQLHNRNHVMKRIVLKDLLDLSQLAMAAERQNPWNGALQIIETPRDRTSAAALIEVWNRTLAPEHGYKPTTGERSWAAAALARLSWPRWRAVASTPFDLMALEWYRATHERGHIARRCDTLLTPARLRQTLVNFSGKQRQRLWS